MLRFALFGTKFCVSQAQSRKFDEEFALQFNGHCRECNSFVKEALFGSRELRVEFMARYPCVFFQPYPQ